MFSSNRLFDAFLWLAVIGLSTWVGGTLYQILVIVPMWSHSPPESVRAFFQQTDYNQNIWRFFGPPFMLARLLPLLLALIAGWRSPFHRRALLIANVCMIFNLIFTLAYIYPINAVLFEQAGGNRSANEIQAMVNQWIFADWLRFAIGLVAFFAVLTALRRSTPATSGR